MAILSDAEAVAKLWRLVGQMPASEDPDACKACLDGKHMECEYEEAGKHQETCGCEFCCS